MRIYVTGNHVELCLQGNGDLHMCGDQTDVNIAQIFQFLDDLLVFYQALV